MEVLTKPFGCSTCGISFAHGESLRGHVLQAHVINKEENKNENTVLKKDKNATKPKEDATKGKVSFKIYDV